MTPQQIHNVINKYRAKLQKANLQPAQFPSEHLVTDWRLQIKHCMWMLDRMEEFLKEDRLEKVNRWLGFIQGVLWAQSIYTIENLKEDNRNGTT
jgi:hypothetical protein